MRAIHKRMTKIFATLIIGLAMLIGGFSHYSAQAASAEELAAQISAIGGLTAHAINATTVNVSGSSTSFPNTTLNIDSGVEIVWSANITGRAAANLYVLTLTGEGTFTLTDGGRLSNNQGSAGGTVYINSGITLNVDDNSIIESPGSGSAVTVLANVQGAAINVRGGTIRSVPSGYAINDGAGTLVDRTNNTQINISGGLVEAGSASAIRSTGRDSRVTVSGGIVTNAATSNTNPTIYMNHAPPPNQQLENIVVSGGIVRTTNGSATSYVLQTTQNLIISGGVVQSIAGRAVNLVGLNSLGTVTGAGRVTTVNGTALSTATTAAVLDDVDNAGFIVDGGIVEATGTGTAIRITGSNSTVDVRDGQVLARSGNAIDASGRPANDSVTVSGGFVFAWGSGVTGATNVIYPEAKLATVNVVGVIVAWATTTGFGTMPYNQGDSVTDLRFLPVNANVSWQINPVQNSFFDGIEVQDVGLNEDFFGLNVEVIQNIFTLTIRTTLDGNPDSSTEDTVLRIRQGESLTLSARPETPINHNINPLDTPTNGDKFIRWAVGASLLSESPETIFTMPSQDVVVTAVFKTRHRLQISGPAAIIITPRNFGSPYLSTSIGYFAEGEPVSLQTSFSSGTYVGATLFTSWGYDTYSAFTDDLRSFSQPERTATIFTMPAYNPQNPTVHIVPDFTYDGIEPVPPTTTRVQQGDILSTTDIEPEPIENPHEYLGFAGSGLNIRAREAQTGERFSHWYRVEGGGGWFENAYERETVFITPGRPVTIEAIFVDVYTLTLETYLQSGERTVVGALGEFSHNEIVSITAPSIPHRFVQWSGGNSGEFDDYTLRSTTFTMPANDATITAEYRLVVFELEVINGTPEQGSYTAGTSVTITGTLPANGMRFVEWVVVSGDITIPNATSRVTTFDMPANNVTLIATYEERRPRPPTVPPTGDYWVDDYSAVAAAHNIPQTGDCNRTGIYITLLIGAAGAIITTLYFGIIKKRFM